MTINSLFPNSWTRRSSSRYSRLSGSLAADSGVPAADWAAGTRVSVPFPLANSTRAARYGFASRMKLTGLSCGTGAITVRRGSRLTTILRLRAITAVAVNGATGAESGLRLGRTRVVSSTSTRSPTRNSGFCSRAGLRCCMMPALPLPQITPRFTGCRRLPSM